MAAASLNVVHRRILGRACIGSLFSSEAAPADKATKADEPASPATTDGDAPANANWQNEKKDLEEKLLRAIQKADAGTSSP